MLHQKIFLHSYLSHLCDGAIDIIFLGLELCFANTTLSWSVQPLNKITPWSRFVFNDTIECKVA